MKSLKKIGVVRVINKTCSLGPFILLLLQTHSDITSISSYMDNVDKH